MTRNFMYFQIVLLVYFVIQPCLRFANCSEKSRTQKRAMYHTETHSLRVIKLNKTVSSQPTAENYKNLSCPNREIDVLVVYKDN